LKICHDFHSGGAFTKTRESNEKSCGKWREELFLDKKDLKGSSEKVAFEQSEL